MAMKPLGLVTTAIMNSGIPAFIEKRTGLCFHWHDITKGLSEYKPLFAQYQNIITWNCKMPPDWVASKCKNVLFVENGLISQRSGVYLDSEGIYSRSRFRMKDWMSQAPRCDPEPHIAKWLGRKAFGGGCPGGPILVCLQSPPDCTLRWEYGLAKQSKDKLAATLELVGKYLPPGRVVLIRPHPRNMKEWDESFGDYSKKYWKKGWELSRYSSLTDLLPHCSAVVSVNSTCLSEAVALGIPAAALGTGIFTGGGVLLECHDDPNRLRGILDYKPDLELARRYCAEILYGHQLPYFPQDETPCEELELWLRRFSAGAAVEPQS
jgi:hypothetical protein